MLRRWVVLATAILLAVAVVSPGGAAGSFGKKFDKQVKKKLSKAGTINVKKNPVNWTRLKGVPEGLADGVDDGLTDIDDCAGGSAIRSIAPDGSVECEVGAVAGGDITAVTAGEGLLGGGDEGDVTLQADTNVMQVRVEDGCFGGAMTEIDANGNVACTSYVWQGLEIVTAQSASNADDIKTVTATCPVGKKVVGGGATVTGFLIFTVALISNYPASNSSWAAAASEFTATAASWRVVAYALCAQTDLPL